MQMRDQNKNPNAKEGNNTYQEDELDVSTISDYLNIEKSVAKIHSSMKNVLNPKRSPIEQRTYAFESTIPGQPKKTTNALVSQPHNFGTTSSDPKGLKIARDRKSNVTNVLKVA